MGSDLVGKVEAGIPYVLRLKSPGSPDKKITYKDLIRVNIEIPENIKSIEFYSYISITEDLNYTFIFNDNSRRNFYLDNEVILTGFLSKEEIESYEAKIAQVKNEIINH